LGTIGHQDNPDICVRSGWQDYMPTHPCDCHTSHIRDPFSRTRFDEACKCTRTANIGDKGFSSSVDEVEAQSGVLAANASELGFGPFKAQLWASTPHLLRIAHGAGATG